MRLLVTEIIAVDPLALAHSAIVAGFDERNDDALAKTARDVKAAGGTLVAQLGIQVAATLATLTFAHGCI